MRLDPSGRIGRLPELLALDSAPSRVRIAPELDVPLTERVRRLIDTTEFRRLAKIPQLGLVSLVYPSATHSRFEHSLGVYRLALLFLRQLARDVRFEAAVDLRAGERFVVAALLHDLGHWPFCHPIEDMGLGSVPRHETRLRRWVEGTELGDLLQADWGLDIAAVEGILLGATADGPECILASLLSGPIDIDKLDYLMRDSLHAGVPYGRNFDQGRLIASLCLNEAGDGLAISEKGKTAAEMMVFARYVMFSEVYWHHGVRAATAMLQRAFWELRDRLDLDVLATLSQESWVAAARREAEGSCASELLDGLFGPRRMLYKRLAQFSWIEQGEVYERVARRPYAWLVACSECLAGELSELLGGKVAAHEVLIDAPPVEKEVEFRIEVRYSEDRYRLLEEVSPVVRTLAREQFDDYVKRVRILVTPRVRSRVCDHEAPWRDRVRDALVRAAELTDARFGSTPPFRDS